VVLSQNGRFWDCAAIALSERHMHVRTDEHKNTVTTQPVFQLDRHQALGNAILLNVYCTTTADPFKCLPFPIPNKIQRIKRTINVANINTQPTPAVLKTDHRTSHAILGAVCAFKCGAYSSITSSKYLALGEHVCDYVTTVNTKK